MIVTLSRRLKRYLITAGIPKKMITVIRSGVDLEKFNSHNDVERREIRSWLRLPEDSPIVLYFGQPSSFRGAETVVHAMAQVSKAIPTARLVFLSRGKVERWLQKETRNSSFLLLIEDTLTQSQLIKILAACDAVALPFRFWPNIECPLTILEAMAMGKPVVTSSFGAIPELVQDGQTGLLVDPPTPARVAESLLRLLTNTDLASAIGKRARTYVTMYHDWERTTQMTLKVFQNSLS
jgi:glycosyltransferase involved in cell wall biosynthesis